MVFVNQNPFFYCTLFYSISKDLVECVVARSHLSKKQPPGYEQEWYEMRGEKDTDLKISYLSSTSPSFSTLCQSVEVAVSQFGPCTQEKHSWGWQSKNIKEIWDSG